MEMEKRLGVGIIGCGAISGSHVNGYLNFPERVQIQAVCDVLEERAQNRAGSIMSESSKRIQQLTEQTETAETSEEKERLTTQRKYLEQYNEEQIQIFTDYNEMLNIPNLDAISICTPPFVHAPAAIAAAQAGNMSTVKNRWR